MPWHSLQTFRPAGGNGGGPGVVPEPPPVVEVSSFVTRLKAWRSLRLEQPHWASKSILLTGFTIQLVVFLSLSTFSSGWPSNEIHHSPSCEGSSPNWPTFAQWQSPLI